ncbi:SoxR reducing system RseC family protein [Thaumasiovibrio sp. DFM-14]|uniref:SoxR reducing system RseC family protein n=1 Tax=Thaumasiovibrio sp. DFM-14 TaxID=3384792 RepID=UPI0039A215A4
MMTSLATVVAVESGCVTVSCEQKSSCGHCGSRDTCGSGIVSTAMPAKQHHIRIVTDETLSVGQWIEIGLPEQTVVRSAVLIYLLPLVAMLLGAVLGQWWFSPNTSMHEGGTIMVAGLFFGLTFLGVKQYSQRLEADSDYQPRVLRVFGEPLSANMMINATQQDSE